MPAKIFSLPNIGTVHVYKRRGTKNIRLSVTSEGKVRITMPTWLPYKAGLAFAAQKQAWLLGQQQYQTDLTNGQRIGKYHTLHLVAQAATDRVHTRVTAIDITVTYPPTASHQAVQQAAHTAAQRALRNEADQLLPQRLADLAKQHGFSYATVGTRHLKTRWGSCNAKGEITLNYYLLQLPWELIDYVLIHELAHTQHLNHSREFWQTVETCLPAYKERRKLLKHYQPSVLAPKTIRTVA